MMTWVKKSGLQSENVANFKKKKKRKQIHRTSCGKDTTFFFRGKILGYYPGF